jgi:hypothetical protein
MRIKPLAEDKLGTFLTAKSRALDPLSAGSNIALTFPHFWRDTHVSHGAGKPLCVADMCLEQRQMKIAAR